VALVVVTRGSVGATAFTARDTLDVKAPTVAVVDTVGAGDSFQAALLTALAERGLATPAALRNLQRQQLTAVCDFAAQAAAITCTRRGADLPRRHELP
jgi:fructokinase